MNPGKGPIRHHPKLLCVFLLFALSGCAPLTGQEGREPGLPDSAPYLYDMHIEGEPAPAFITAKGGFFMWKVGDTWHVRVAGTAIPSAAYPRSIVAGNIFIEDGFVRITKKQIPRPPDELRFARDNLSFRFEVGSGRETREFEFAVQPLVRGYCVVLDVSVNGRADPQFIHLGRTLVTPSLLPSRVCVRD